MINFFSNMLKLALGFLTGLGMTQLIWVYRQLTKADPDFTLSVPQNKAPEGISVIQENTEKKYFVQHVIEDGIERVRYVPKERRFATPILMLHGMWHGAWCWTAWQALFAEWGWESYAISLPGHGRSPVQRPIQLCTLDYYLAFVRDQVEKLPHKPVLLGHSMGAALTQWYLKYVGDNLPAAVFVASWVSHSIRADGGAAMMKKDPAIFLWALRSWDSTPWVRNPQRTAEKLLGPKANISPQDLHARLGPESILVAFQHNPPFWQPPEQVKTPSLWLAGELDTVSSSEGLRKSAVHYSGDFVLIPDSGHNLMMEHHSLKTAWGIHDWLLAQNIK